MHLLNIDDIMISMNYLEEIYSNRELTKKLLNK